LYQLEKKPNQDELLECNNDQVTEKEAEMRMDCSEFSEKCDQNKKAKELSSARACCKNLKEKLASFQDSMLCRICMDADVCTAFFPCRHVVCCSGCAPLCDICPLCRTLVQNSQHIYLPVAGAPLRDCDEAKL